MNLCSSNHDEVCYEGKTCPVCEAKGEIKDLESEITSLKTTIDQLENAE